MSNSGSWYDQKSEQEILKAALDRNSAIENFKTSATEQTSKNISTIYRENPWMSAGSVLALAKGNASPETVSTISKTAARVGMQQADPTVPKKQSWFERNVMGKIKTATRWSVAGLQAFPELAQNAASRVAGPNSGSDGWFASTTLGQMIENSDQAGSGFFAGEKLMKTQAEKAREFRGEINGSAWTIGRAAADIVFTPGSLEYNLLSGAFDAAVNIGTDPTLYAGKALKAARVGRAAIPAVESATETTALLRAVATKTVAGLSEAESIAFEANKFAQWATKSSAANRLWENLAKEENPYKILLSFGDTMDPNTAQRLAGIKTADGVREVFTEAAVRLDNAVGGVNDILLPTNINDISMASRSYATKQKLPLYQFLDSKRLFGAMPQSVLQLTGDGRSNTKAILNTGKFVKQIGLNVADGTGKKIIDKAFEAFSSVGGGADRKALDDLMYEATGLAIKQSGGSDELVKTVVEKTRKALDEARNYGINETGGIEDGGYIKYLYDKKLIPEKIRVKFTPDQWANELRMHGPGALSEMLDNVQILPNPREIRRITQNPFWQKAITKAKTAATDGAYTGVGRVDPNPVVAMADLLQNSVWKPLTLATGGYMMRNMADSQLRMAMSGLDGFFTHPIRYIHWATNTLGVGTLDGEKLDRKVLSLVDNWSAETDDFKEAMTFGSQAHSTNAVDDVDRLVRTDEWDLVERQGNKDVHTTGVVQSLRHGQQDPFISFAARLEGLPDDEQLRIVRSWMASTAEGKKARKQVESRIRNGWTIVDGKGDKTFIAGLGKLSDDEMDLAIDGWITDQAPGRARVLITNFAPKAKGEIDSDLKFLVGHNALPEGDTFQTTLENLKDTVLPYGKSTDKTVRQGQRVALGDNRFGVIVDRVEVGNNFKNPKYEYVVQPMGDQGLLDEARGSQSLRKLLDAKGDADQLPKIVKYAKSAKEMKPTSNAAVVAGAFDKFTDTFFNGIYGRAAQKLERSVVYRQFYYKRAAENAELLNPQEAQKLLKNLTEYAANEGTTAEKYVGGKKVLASIQAQADNTASKAAGTVQQLSEYASAIALRETKELLYNAVDRNNLEDILRIVIPFGPAWKEVIGTYATALIDDPTRVRKAQQIFTGATNADPDQDGRGFFYKDPQTGENMFTFPFSGELTKLVGGIPAAIQVPIKRLSLGFNVIPALGPVGQIAASALLPDTPAFQDITELLLPYGKSSADALVPGWVKKISSGLEANPAKLGTIYSNTYIETVRALSASGKYDLSDQNEQDQLLEDAKSKAKRLTILRGFIQFTGPTAPSLDFKIKYGEGVDTYSSELIKAFYKFQTLNYDTAVSEFINVFGDDAFLYMSSKTQAVAGGLEATSQFGDWEKMNEPLFEKYPKVAGFLAPGGDDFSFATWERQVRTGKRVRLSAREILEQAQNKIGSSLYRAARLKAGSYPSDEMRVWLRSYRKSISKEYPGFSAVAQFNVGEFDDVISKLKTMVADPDVKGNVNADSIRQYLSYRDSALAKVQAAGYVDLSSKAAAPLRDWLASIAEQIIVENPEFGRIYQRELSPEVED